MQSEAIDHTRLILPQAPESEAGEVKAWEEDVTLRTYQPAAPYRNPLFLEKRVYQGSSGRVYPLPVIDRIDTEPSPQNWQAVHLENRYLRMMVLPQIGGRIHVGMDKINDYDFFYRQNVIKPALVGLAGPWISGGVEFNWPQHHRPATYMPVEVKIERSSDGSITVWCSDHDPMSRMKGMHGICLYPDKAYVEVKVRLYNRTEQTQTFLWWANVATHVHEQYQSFFPKDVRFAADHAKRAITEFSLSQSIYYGVDYGKRAQQGVPAEETPSHFVPDGSYPSNDLSWYANIPVPTSYMIVGSKGDFAGGYDHKRQAGVVSYANHHISPGKKQWTWGNHEFGYAWDRSLTDEDGPYVELMAGVYTDNQPDFSFLAPGETKTFSQFWYPIREIGVPDLANLNAALRVEAGMDGLNVHIQVTEDRPQSVVLLRSGAKEIGRWQGDLLAAKPLHTFFESQRHIDDFELILEQNSSILLRYCPAEIGVADPPEIATEPSTPEQTSTLEELYLTGLHLEQYRHPTRYPEAYWQEALRRDPYDSRCNNALGRWHLRRGELKQAEQHLRAAITRITARNPNPYDGEPYYNLGLTLVAQRRPKDAYNAFYKATWNSTWRGPAYHRLAEIDCSRKEWRAALDHLDRSLIADTENLNARNLKVIVLRRLHHEAEAESLLRETLALDPLDIFARHLNDGSAPKNGQQCLDIAFDLMLPGEYEDALGILSEVEESSDGARTIALYLKADLLTRLNYETEAKAAYREAALADPAYVFPSRLQEMLLFEESIRRQPDDARAHYYLGNLLYDCKRHQEAIAHWERSVELNPSLATAWRNLGFGYFNIANATEKALDAFRHARDLAPDDARILYEYDQLLKRTGESPESRLMQLQAHASMVNQRDDLSIELASLLNSAAMPQAALDLLNGRHFQPWEGGEGQVLAQFVRSHILLAQLALKNDIPSMALQRLYTAISPPASLSEARHLLQNRSMIDYWLGKSLKLDGDLDAAAKTLERAARSIGDFQQMQVQEVSDMTYWSAKALEELGRVEEAAALFEKIGDYARHLRTETPKIDYFATSLPAMLLFEEDIKKRQDITADFLEAQSFLGLRLTQQGIELLRRILHNDRNHIGAIDMMRTLES
jgi:tetratricopeptide (TPR) repeat protein